MGCTFTTSAHNGEVFATLRWDDGALVQLDLTPDEAAELAHALKVRANVARCSGAVVPDEEWGQADVAYRLQDEREAAAARAEAERGQG